QLQFADHIFDLAPSFCAPSTAPPHPHDLRCDDVQHTNSLYCSDVCRDADAVQLPPSSIDHAIDLGFITDSIPPLVSSARPPRNPEDPSAVSSPTSSILTTPSVLDELDVEQVVGLPPAAKVDPSTTKATTTTAGAAVMDSLLLPQTTTIQKPPTSPIPPHFHLPPTQPQQQSQQAPTQALSPRLKPTTPSALPFARKPGYTNIHTPPPSTQHHVHPTQSGSSSCSRGPGSGHHHNGHHTHHHPHHRRTGSASVGGQATALPSAPVIAGGAGTSGGAGAAAAAGGYA
ncbi:hypothetical protein FRB90_010227, partial [Tulasnella sp. 427]